MTVRTLLRTISSRELTEWMAYERLTGPLGQARDDALTSLLCAVIANAQRGKGQKARTPADFLPRWDGQGKTPEELFQAALAANAAIGGVVVTLDN